MKDDAIRTERIDDEFDAGTSKNRELYDELIVNNTNNKQLLSSIHPFTPSLYELLFL